MDPLAELHYGVSPYAYVLNNPIRFVDPDGRNSQDLHTAGAYNANRSWYSPPDDYYFSETGKVAYVSETQKADRFFKRDSEGLITETSQSELSSEMLNEYELISEALASGRLSFDGGVLGFETSDPWQISVPLTYRKPNGGFSAIELISNPLGPLKGINIAKGIRAAKGGTNIAKNAKKMSPDDIGKFLNAGKDWHKGSSKGNFLKQFKKELKGDTNAGFYIDKTTREVFLKSNKSGNWINTGQKFD